MGLFDRFKKKEAPPAVSAAPIMEHKPCGPNIIEIARLISQDNEAVLRDVTACTKDPAAWYDAHQGQYFERSITSADDLELVQWIGLVDILEECGWVCERDWKDELEDFLYFAKNLHGFQAQGLSMNPDWFDANENIPAWCNILTEKWTPQSVRMAAIGIDSDSYVLFPYPVPQLPTLQKLAEEIGQYIGFVE